jgi:hypothetical protein
MHEAMPPRWLSLSFFVVKTGLRPASLLVLLRLVVVVEASA